MKGEITDLQYEGNTIGLINIDGEFRQKRFTGGVYVNDELLALNFLGSADFSSELPIYETNCVTLAFTLHNLPAYEHKPVPNLHCALPIPPKPA